MMNECKNRCTIVWCTNWTKIIYAWMLNTNVLHHTYEHQQQFLHFQRQHKTKHDDTDTFMTSNNNKCKKLICDTYKASVTALLPLSLLASHRHHYQAKVLTEIKNQNFTQNNKNPIVVCVYVYWIDLNQMLVTWWWGLCSRGIWGCWRSWPTGPVIIFHTPT